MTKKEIAQIIAKKANISPKEAERLVVAFGDAISEALERGEKVVYSNFGTFYTVHYPSKVITHPRLGAAKKMIMLPTNVAKWMPSGNIKKMVAEHLQVKNPTLHGATRKKAAHDTTVDGLTPKSPEHKHQNSKEDKEDDEVVEVKVHKTPAHVGAGLIPVQKQSFTDKPAHNTESPEEKAHDNKVNDNPAPQDMKDTNKSFWDKLFNSAKSDAQVPVDTKPEKPVQDQPKAISGTGLFENAVSQSVSSLGLTNSTTKVENNQPKSEQEENAQSLIQEAGLTNTDSGANDKPPMPHDATSDELPMAPLASIQTDYEFIDLSKINIPKEVLQQLPEKIARKYKAVPVSDQDNKITVAMTDPEDLEAREMIKKIVPKHVTIKLTTETDINHVLDQYQGLESEVQEAIEEADEDQVDSNQEELSKQMLIESANDDAPAARIVASILRRATGDKASDIHIEPFETEVQVRFRIDGILIRKITLPRDVQQAITSRIKILANLKIDEQRLPQDGRFSMKFENRKVDFRISTMPTAFGEKIVMRILDKSTGILTLEQLGLADSGLKALEANLDKSHGMILVTGPTGSGKSTSLYALIDRLYEEGVNIVTLEDPIEYQMTGINQSQVNHEIDYTFASGLRSIVRQDPDIIMIGEIRDGETAQMAVQAALTGHVVLSTLHTNEAAGAAPRLIDMGVEPFLLTSSINVVIGQRLARKICADCKEEVELPKPEVDAIKQVIAKMPKKEREEFSKKKLTFFKGKGCKTCGDSGYKGRVGLYEVLPITEETKELVLKRVSSYQIQEKAIEDGMVTMIQDGVIKAIKGITTIEEVWRVTKD